MHQPVKGFLPIFDRLSALDCNAGRAPLRERLVKNLVDTPLDLPLERLIEIPIDLVTIAPREPIFTPVTNVPSH